MKNINKYIQKHTRVEPFINWLVAPSTSESPLHKGRFVLVSGHRRHRRLRHGTPSVSAKMWVSIDSTTHIFGHQNMWRDSMQVLIGQEKFHLISYDVIIDPKPVKFRPQNMTLQRNNQLNSRFTRNFNWFSKDLGCVRANRLGGLWQLNGQTVGESNLPSFVLPVFLLELFPSSYCRKFGWEEFCVTFYVF